MARKNNELLKDYNMLEKMASDLAKHQKNIKTIGRRIARRSRSDLTYGFEDSLEMVITHMQKAQEELERAVKEIKNI